MDTPVYFDYGEADAIATLLEEMTRLRLEKTALAQTIEDRDQTLVGLNEQITKMQELLGNLPISPANLNAMGYGDTRPVANNETAEGRKRNRRIDVVIKPQWIDAQTIARVQMTEPVQLPDLVLDQ